MKIMKKSRCALLIGAALLAALPAAAAPAVIQHFSGATANADFLLTEPDGCTFTAVYLIANEGRNHNDPVFPDTGAYLNLGIFKWSECAGYQELISANGGGTIPRDVFKPQGNLNGATLDTVVQVTDFVSGNTYDVPVSLVWAPEGEIGRTTTHERLSFRPYHYTWRWTGNYRNAQVSGQVMFAGTDLTEGAVEAGQLSHVHGGSVRIEPF